MRRLLRQILIKSQLEVFREILFLSWFRQISKNPPHFIPLFVRESAATPSSRDVQQTYFELQKRSMPELDVFTQSELQWGALKTSVIGMFYR